MGWSPDEYIADTGNHVYLAGGVDVVMFDNSEFDRDAAVLKKGIETDTNFPLLLTNVHGSSILKRDEDYVAAVTSESKRLRISFICLATYVDTRGVNLAD